LPQLDCFAAALNINLITIPLWILLAITRRT
jgi:hypothetical protein